MLHKHGKSLSLVLFLPVVLLCPSAQGQLTYPVASPKYWVYASPEPQPLAYRRDTPANRSWYQARRMVRDYYAILLGRPASDADLAYQADNVRSGAVSRIEFIMGFYYSPEFKTLHRVQSLSSDQFVQMTFRTLLERDRTASDANLPADATPQARDVFFMTIADSLESKMRNGDCSGTQDAFTYTAYEGKLGKLWDGSAAFKLFRKYEGRQCLWGAEWGTPRCPIDDALPVKVSGIWEAQDPLHDGYRDTAGQLYIKDDVWYLFNRDQEYRTDPNNRPTVGDERYQITVRVSYNQGVTWSKEKPIATGQIDSIDRKSVTDAEAVFDGTKWNLMAQCLATTPNAGYGICHYSLQNVDPLEPTSAVISGFAANPYNPIAGWTYAYPPVLMDNWNNLWKWYACQSYFEPACTPAVYNSRAGVYDYRQVGTPTTVGSLFGTYQIGFHGARNAETSSAGLFKWNLQPGGFVTPFDSAALETLPFRYNESDQLHYPRELMKPSDCQNVYVDGVNRCVGIGHFSIIRDGVYYYMIAEAPTLSMGRVDGQFWPFLIYRSPRLSGTGTWEPFWGSPAVAAKAPVAERPELLGYAKFVPTKSDNTLPGFEILLTFYDIRRKVGINTERSDFYVFKLTENASVAPQECTNWVNAPPAPPQP